MGDKNFNIDEKSTGKYTATLTDEDGVVIPLADLDAITLTLFLPESSENTVINSRNQQDIKNDNNVTIHNTSGLLTWLIQQGDTTITDTEREEPHEIHRAMFEFQFQTSKYGKHIVDLYVQNLRRVP